MKVLNQVHQYAGQAPFSRGFRSRGAGRKQCTREQTIQGGTGRSGEDAQTESGDEEGQAEGLGFLNKDGGGETRV